MRVNYIVNGETKVLGDIIGENVGIYEMYQGVLENDKYGIPIIQIDLIGWNLELIWSGFYRCYLALRYCT